MAEKWFLMQAFSKASFFNWVIQMRNASIGWKDLFGITNSLTVHKEGMIYLHFNQKQWRQMGEKVLDKILQEPQWISEIIKKIYKETELFFQFLKSWEEKEFKNLTDKQLSEEMAQFENHRREVHLPGVIGTILEFDHELFTKYLQGYLEKQIKSTGNPLTVSGIFSELTIFHKDTFLRQEEKAMLQLVKEVQLQPKAVDFITNYSTKDIIDKLSNHFFKIDKKLEHHFQQFRWIQYQHIGPAWEKDYFVEVLSGLLKENIDPDKKLKEFVSKTKQAKMKQRHLIRSVNIDSFHKQLFNLAQELSFVKSLRNDSFFYGFYCVEPLLKEIARRLHISISQLRTFLPGEIQDALLKHNYSADDLNERWEYSVYSILEGKESLFLGKNAKKLVERIEESEPKIVITNKIIGTVAVPGEVQGIVKIINEVEDIVKMEEGNILVSNATYPSLVSAMKKASAIVTDLGGITCHAAIVSRELGIPCVIGTKIATQVLKDGDKVEVDANNGVVKKLN